MIPPANRPDPGCPLCGRLSPLGVSRDCGLTYYTSSSGWTIKFDFIARMATALKNLHPDVYHATVAALSVEMPQDLPRLLEALKSHQH